MAFRVVDDCLRFLRGDAQTLHHDIGGRAIYIDRRDDGRKVCLQVLHDRGKLVVSTLGPSRRCSFGD